MPRKKAFTIHGKPDAVRSWMEKLRKEAQHRPGGKEVMEKINRATKNYQRRNHLDGDFKEKPNKPPNKGDDALNRRRLMKAWRKKKG